MPFVLLGRALVAFELRGKQFKALTIMWLGGGGWYNNYRLVSSFSLI